MTDIQSNIKSNIIKIDEKYYSYPIYDYWILSSHNTYLPFDQYVGDANMCYYNLITSVFMGGCVEVDLYGIYEKDKIYDIKVRHAPTKKNFLKLSELLKKIVLLMKRKYQLKKEGKNLPVGPLIISFDNKDLSFDEKKHKKDDRKHSQNIFWQILEDNLLKYDNTFCNKNLSELKTNCPWIQIIDENSIDYTKIKLEDLDMKILLRGKENKSIQREIPQHITGGSTKKMFIPPSDTLFSSYKDIFKTTNRWFHLTNTKLNAFEGKSIDNSGNPIKNMSESIPSVGIKKLGGNESPIIKDVEQNHKVFHYAIENTQNNLIRIFPDGTRALSANYDNLGYLMNGCQVVALNFQAIDKPWFQNMALFNPNFFTLCNEKCETGKIHDLVASKIHKIQSYVLKPIWLRSDGNISEYPKKHNITINIKISKNKNDKKESNKLDKKQKISIEIGINKKELIDIEYDKEIEIKLENINVTLPIIYIQLSSGNTFYKGAYLLEWTEKDKSNKNINIYLYKFKVKDSAFNKLRKEKNKVYYNDIPTLKAKDNKYNLCDENTFFMNILKKINCNITYSWTETDNIIIDNDTTKTTKTIKIDKNEDEDDIQYVKTDKELKEANIDVVKETDSTDSTDSIDSKNSKNSTKSTKST